MVQKPDLSDDEIRASSTAGIAIGLICMAVTWVLAPALGVLFEAPTLPPIVRGLSVSFVFMGWSQTGNGLLRRQLRFRALSLVTVATYVFSYLVVGVGLALLGAGLWSLVAASVTSTAVQAVLQYALLRHPVRPVLRWEPYRAVCGYGARLSGAYLMDYIGGNLDTFTVTRIASTAVLGQYSRAYYLVFQPLGNYLAQALSTVLFSMLSRVQQDLARLRRAFLSVLSITSLVLFPMCAGMAVAAQELTRVVLGPQWTLVPGLVPWFALAGGCHVASQMCQLLAEARAELNRSMAVQVTYLVALVLLLLAAVPFRDYGVWVIAAAVAGAEVLRYLGYLRPDRAGPRADPPGVAGPSARCVRQCRGRASRCGPAGPLDSHAPAILVLAAEIVRWGARAGPLHQALPLAGHPPRATPPARRGRPAGRGSADCAGGWPGWSSGRRRRRRRRPPVTVLALLGVVLLVVGAAGLVLLEVLIKRPDVAAAMLFATVVVQALLSTRCRRCSCPARRIVRYRHGRRPDHGRSAGPGPAPEALRPLPTLAAAAGRTARRLTSAGGGRLRDANSGQRLPSVPVLLRRRPVLLDLRPVPGAVGPDRSHLADHDRAHDGAGQLALGAELRRAAVGRPGREVGRRRRHPRPRRPLRVLPGPGLCAHYPGLAARAQTLRGQLQRVLSVLLLLMVIALNRRTAWLAVVAGIAVLLLRDRRLGRRAMTLVVLGGALAVVGFVALGGLQEGAAQPVTQEDTGNFTWRVEGWSDLLGGWPTTRCRGSSASRSAAASPARSTVRRSPRTRTTSTSRP